MGEGPDCLTSRIGSSHFVLMDDGQPHTLGLLERLRTECKVLWGMLSELYFRVDGLLRLTYRSRQNRERG